MIKAFLIAGAIGATLLLLIAGGSIYEGGVFRNSGTSLPQGGGTAGCYIPDNKIRDTTTITSGKQASTLLNHPNTNSQTKIAELDKIIKDANQAKINPALIIAIWGQESGFSDTNNRVFGVLKAPSGFESQEDASIATVNKHLKDAETGNRQISDPKYGNYIAKSQFDYVMTRYTPTYNPGFGNDPERKNLISFLKKLIPGDIICENTDKGICPFSTQKPLNLYPEMNSNYSTPKVIILHYLGTTGNNKALTIDQAWHYFENINNNKNPNDNKYVQFAIAQSGNIYQFLPETKQVAGAMGYNVALGGITISIENEGQFESSIQSLQYTQAQLGSNIKLVKYLMQKYNISKENVISHKQADERAIQLGTLDKIHRSDPGEEFMKAVLSQL